ncbi:ABC transporter ATP-binding protein [Aquisalimonas asiatica]|uniref:Putative ABC transport system ATP-binding protein n=1 Tax=Aquisalimonas asiatica TaxID=406100 RepID=A0A1H8V2T8_9GAMM|nr:ABC transporter ATP-binding protein [Aquisalimonas asiatica]SEP09802.1 putative ABC transport system ATP-binding protein [Aquisalimonas asiatica]
MIVLDQVSRAFTEGGRSRVVLDRFSETVATGERLAVVGRSGVGKSTLLNLLGGMDVPDAGRVHIGDAELTAMNERERTLLRRHRIGFVFQFFNLIPTLTVTENLLMPLEMTGGVDTAGRQRARGLLERVGLADREEAFPDALSGGEQQRIAIARALVHAPDVLLADEPTGTLDEDTAEEVLALLDELTGQGQVTVVLVTHSMAVAHRMDRVLRLGGGTG